MQSIAARCRQLWCACVTYAIIKVCNCLQRPQTFARKWACIVSHPLYPSLSRPPLSRTARIKVHIVPELVKSSESCIEFVRFPSQDAVHLHRHTQSLLSHDPRTEHLLSPAHKALCHMLLVQNTFCLLYTRFSVTCSSIEHILSPSL